MIHASFAPIRACSPELCTIAYIRFTAVNLSLYESSMTLCGVKGSVSFRQERPQVRCAPKDALVPALLRRSATAPVKAGMTALSNVVIGRGSAHHHCDAVGLKERT